MVLNFVGVFNWFFYVKISEIFNFLIFVFVIYFRFVCMN